MAAIAETQPASMATDIASLLAPEDIPVKLRCAICSKLAVNAVKLPCCDQSICETCHSKLPASCPVCEHTPISAEDCKPNKNLRTTIRVYLRTEEKKREIAKGHAQNEKPPESTSLSATESKHQPGRAPPHSAVQHGGVDEKVKTQVIGSSRAEDKETENIEQAQKIDIQYNQTAEDEHSRKEVATGHNESFVQNGVSADPQNQVVSGVDKGDEPAGEQNLNGRVVGGEGEERNGGTAVGQPQSLNSGALGADPMQAGYPNMGWNAQNGFDPLMPNMQTPMANGQWNMFPNMMGMPAMNMNPMSTSPGMFGGFDGRGMGMNGINGMNMNMNVGVGMGMGPNVGGHGGYGGWTGQTGWNAGQEKFNPMGNVGNNMGANFGAGSAGYGGYHHPANATTAAAAGYNFQSTNGNYSQMPQNQLYHQNHNFQSGFHGRLGHGYPPRGPRGGWHGRHFNPQGVFPGGRGYGQGQGYSGENEPFHQQLPPQLRQTTAEPNQQMEEAGAHRSDSGLDGSTEAKAVAGGDMETASRGDDVDADPDHLREAKLSRDQGPPENANDATAAHEVDAAINTTRKSEENNSITMMNEQDGAYASADHPVDKKNVESVTTAVLKAPHGLQTTDIKVVNAPLGPAAHLGRGRGLPRGVPRGPAGRGGRGAANFWSNPQGIVPPPGPGPAVARTDLPGVVPVEPRGRGVEGAPTAPKAMRRGGPIPIVGRGGSSTATGGRVMTTATKARSQSPDREKSRSRTRSPDHGQSHHSRRHRHRSRSSSDEDSERERRHERRSRHSRRDDHDRLEDKNREGRRKRSRERSIDRSVSRSRSVSSTRRKSSNRTRREREHRDGENQHSSHRSRPERESSRDRRQRPRRSRSPSSSRPMINDEGETRTQRRMSDIRGPSQLSPTSTRRRSSRDRFDKYRERERDGPRRSRRERAESKSDSERDRRNGRRNHRHEERGIDKPREKDRDRARERDEGRDTTRGAANKGTTTASTAATDYHTLEREARNRERLLADQARKRERAADDDDTGGGGAGAGGGGADLAADNNNTNNDAAGGQDSRSSKRRRHHRRRGSSRRRASNANAAAHGGDVSVRPAPGAEKLAAVILGGRKMSVKYEGDESDEARAARIEKEREAQRWE